MFVQADLDDARKQHLAFAVLRAVITRHVVVPELYDVMDRVQSLLVVSKDDSARAQARQVMVPFVLDYPLGRKRIDKIITFLVANLGYEFDSGRASVLSTLDALIAKVCNT